MRPESDSGSSGGGDLKRFPASKMRTTAGNMTTNANNALAEHERSWARIQAYINRFPGFMQGPVRAVLEAYEKRLRASYQWQLDCANALIQGAEATETTDTQMAQSFNGYEDNTDTGRHAGRGGMWAP
ncbi:MAG: hypothetical protein M3Z08_06380 [Chloroflexota bacterium]|nr:hypothetical protein [Chloroflexota bacterium]